MVVSPIRPVNCNCRLAIFAPGTAVLALSFIGLLAGCSRGPSSTSPDYTGSKSCLECHQRFYQLWSTSFHGLAMQPYTLEFARSKLTPQTNEILSGSYAFQADIGQGSVSERTGRQTERYRITQVMGGKNVFYFLTPLQHGRLQVLPVAYDVRRQEWFDTTRSAMRHFSDRPDEALYWKERPLTFNTSCFSCHVSQLSKNYELASDSYHTHWAEPGINCETCHGPGAEHVRLFRRLGTNSPPQDDLKLVVARKLSTAQRNDLCASCHARLSPLTATFAPGDRFFDHFDLVAWENPDFYPDGRDLGENYTYTHWLNSPCVRSGKLDCLHCHTSSGRYRFQEPAQANYACLPCHKDKVDTAPEHAHHKAGSPGSRCIGCHMPQTEFARMRRTDHSMLPPTPALTLKYKSPNACNLCHTNDPAWSDRYVREWRTRDYQQPVLERAALIDAARKRNWQQLPAILEYLTCPQHEEIQTVSLVRLLRDCHADLKWEPLRKLLTDASPLVRGAATEALGDKLDQVNIAALAAATEDDFRLVRVRAAAALGSVPEHSVPESHRAGLKAAMLEFTGSLAARPDDMASHYNLGNFHFSRSELPQAVAEFELATRLQPDALPPHVNLALAYSALGRNQDAEASLRRALALDPTNSPAQLNLGMLMAEMGREPEAEKAFRAALQSDPRSAQAAFNLGVLLSSKAPAEALDWCQKAVGLNPQEPRYAYTLAFYQDQQGRSALAVQTLEGLLKTSPATPDPYHLLISIYQRLGQPDKARTVSLRAAENSKLPSEVRAEFGANLER